MVYWYLIPFLSEAVEASLCNFFKNWLMKLKFPNLLNPLWIIIQWNDWSFYPSELNYFSHFNMRYPVCKSRLQAHSSVIFCHPLRPGEIFRSGCVDGPRVRHHGSLSKGHLILISVSMAQEKNSADSTWSNLLLSLKRNNQTWNGGRGTSRGTTPVCEKVEKIRD